MFRAYVGGDGRRRPRGLRTWVLHILGRRPMNGAEIMEQMDQMTRGLWRPSPGSIYPLLEQLVEDGLIVKGEDGRYSLTPAARQAPPWGFDLNLGAPRDPEAVVGEVESYIRYLEDVGASDPSRLSSLRDRLTSVARRVDRLAGGRTGTGAGAARGER